MVTEFLHQMNFKSYRLFVDAFAFTRQKKKAGRAKSIGPRAHF